MESSDIDTCWFADSGIERRSGVGASGPGPRRIRRAPANPAARRPRSNPAGRVGGLEVAVDDALLVGLFERLGDLERDVEGLVDGDRAAPEALLEVFSLDELESKERRPLDLLEPVDRGDVRVVERGEKLRLASEPRQALGVLRDLCREHLDGDFTVESRVGGPVDLTHPARPEGGGDAIVREGLADHLRAFPSVSRDSHHFMVFVTRSLASCWTK
jgi:hypothetical protein